jgi:PKD repeat protein
MNKILLFIFFQCALCIMHSARGQNPLVKMWDYRYGGTYPDELTCFQQTRDGGFILAGYSNSAANGDKSQPSYGDYDYWIVKLDRFGIKEWDADFGGTDYDNLTSITQTADGGYLLGGYSLSNTGGCKTQDNWDPGGLSHDFWIVKTDSVGTKLWDKGFGGLDDDRLNSLQQLPDGGYILGGLSGSGIGGDKSQISRGGNDYWIIRTDGTGNKLWDATFGGSQTEVLRSVRQTPDNGFILGGLSGSTISGDKTQPSFGMYDFWVIKADSIGGFVWDLAYGGTDNDYLWALEGTRDNGFILGGISFSGPGGNKTSALWGAGTVDLWVVKTDAAGGIQWQRNLGGTDMEDEFGNISVADDGGYVFGGTSYSPISGDKTENNLGSEQGWFVKTDSLGNTVLDKTIAINGHDEHGYAVQTKEGCYAFAHFNGAPPGGLKSQVTQGVFDYWIVRFCDSAMLPVSAFASVNPICPGTCASFQNLSLRATSYLWFFPGGSPAFSSDVNPSSICYNTPGSYDVTLIATSAQSSDTLTLMNFVTVYPYPPPQGITQSGDTLFANPGAVSYQWYYNGVAITGATDYFYVTVLNGDYNVVATDVNGCEVEAVIFNVTSVDDPGDAWSPLIYPNPVDETLFVNRYQLNETADEISVYNVLGAKLYPAVDGRLWTVDCGLLPAGMYYIEISSAGKIFRSKFIKK